MVESPQILTVDPLGTAFIHVTVPRSQIQQVMGPGIRELVGAVSAQGIGPSGPWLCHHLRMDADVFDFRISVPVTGPVTPVGRVEPGTLPGGRVARAVYQGGYEGLGAAWGEFKAWIAAQGLAEAPGLWEVYLVGPESSPDPAAWRTQLTQPLAG